MTPFGNFEPDKGRFSPGSSNYILNAVPVAGGWGPLAAAAEVSEALAAEPKGAIAVRSSTGAFSIFAFTAAKAYKLNSADYSWTDVTRLVGGDYATAADDRWSLSQYGIYLVATNGADEPQVFDIDGGTNFEDLGGSPPVAKYNWVMGEHLVLGNISGFPNRVRVSGRGDIGYWTVGQKGSDYDDLPDGEDVQGGVGSPTGSLIIQRKAIRRMALNFGGGDYSYRIEVVNPNRGAISADSIVPVGPGNAAFLSSDGFVLGVEGKPIGLERVDRYFFDNALSDSVETTRGGIDPYQRIIWWRVESAAGTTRLGYHYGLDRWCMSEDDVLFFVDLATPAVTIDGLDLLYASIDDVSEAFNSRLFSGGLPALAGFTSDYKLAFFTGTNKAATLDTWEMPLVQGRRAFLQECRAVTDATTHTMQVAPADRHSATDPTFGSAVSPNSSTGICHFRSDGRAHKFRLNIAAGETWSHVYGIDDIRAQPSGRR